MPKTILLVDDEDLVTCSVGQLLKKQGAVCRSREAGKKRSLLPQKPWI